MKTREDVGADCSIYDHEHPFVECLSVLLDQNSAKRREQDQTDGENMAPPRKIARTDSRELNEDS